LSFAVSFTAQGDKLRPMFQSGFSDSKQFMAEAVRLAQQARGLTSPNPMVGAVVVSPLGEIIGRGFHPKAGESHAEVFAIREARKTHPSLTGCTIYVTLEPCNHFGRTPPCADLVLTSGISRVVVGAIDPNPKMQGKSIEKLRQNGITVDVGVLQDDCEKLIRGFKSVMTTKRPFVTLKCATSLDGKIATATGESQWITGSEARAAGHVERAEHDAILVGIGTVLADDPQLTARIDEKVSSLTKVIIDSQLRTPSTARIFKTPGRVIIYCSQFASILSRTELEKASATVVAVPSDGVNGLDLRAVLADLANQGVQELLVEGGAKILGGFAREKLFDRVLYFLAPRIFGSGSRDAFEGLRTESLSESIEIKPMNMRLVGGDILIEGVRACSPV
jgi:diaminohydroxyphosphoribosylaminopyrimidine deaminase / 5-amino-6-(5-phosphoribosylamino)uracil reductase